MKIKLKYKAIAAKSNMLTLAKERFGADDVANFFKIVKAVNESIGVLHISIGITSTITPLPPKKNGYDYDSNVQELLKTFDKLTNKKFSVSDTTVGGERTKTRYNNSIGNFRFSVNADTNVAGSFVSSITVTHSKPVPNSIDWIEQFR